MQFERYGKGIAKGMVVTFKNLVRRPVTIQYPEERLTVSRRIRGTELIWDKERCSGCSTCAKSCHQGTIRIKTTDNGQVRAPCSQTCPAGIDIPSYLRFIAEGKPAEAVAVIREKIPFPVVCGRVCFHPCETVCQRTQLDGAISIRVLKRHATDHDTGVWKERVKAVAPATGKRVAVVGAGPAGLTAAYYLARLGHSVTVFEALPEPGGMMRVGIPDYRLPKDLLRAEIDEIRAVGVDIKTNTRIDSLDELLAQGYQAIFIGLGAHQGMSVGVEGDDDPRVMDCASFLRDVSLGKEVKVGNKVAVIGGGNAAIDSARTALRFGSKEVIIVYRRTRAEMPANPEEVEAALDEGIEMNFLAAPSRIYSQDGEFYLEAIRMQLGEPDASGRRRPVPVKGSEFATAYDNIIAAIGQRPDTPEQFGITIGRGNVIEADPETLATSREGVFAGGDAVTGPASVIEAIAAGRRGASSIDKYLGGSGEIDETLATRQSPTIPLTEPEPGDRVHPHELSTEQRVKDFAEVELELSEEMAVKEANRCLMCDVMYEVEKFEVDTGHCIFCGLCIEACPRNALHIDYEYEHASYRRRDLILEKEDMLLTSDRRPSGYARPEFEVLLPRQTLLADRDKVKQ